jgi:ketosteroid isomerase-like protein
MKMVSAIALLFLGASIASAQTQQASTQQELTRILRQFLNDAGLGNRSGFETFFADDVIYTRSTGAVVDKADILKDVESLKPTADSKTTYSAEDITVHLYGAAAVVAFRLVATTQHNDGKVETAHYRNTGTFVKRNGRWQAVAWQATRISGQ